MALPNAGLRAEFEAAGAQHGEAGAMHVILSLRWRSEVANSQHEKWM
jgi:hypothetical protein